MKCKIEGCENTLSSIQRSYCSEPCKMEGKNIRYRKNYIPVKTKRISKQRQEEIDYLESFGIGKVVSTTVIKQEKEIVDLDLIRECQQKSI